MGVQTSPRLTDERLRSWLDTSQLDRERLCQAIISLDRRFANVNPRHPRGGPDGGRDLEAQYVNGRKAWVAIGFRNSASDSTADKRWVKKKFKDDLSSAQANEHALRVFVFMTNVCLTAGEKQALIGQAKGRGVEVCHVFDRENLRIVLDSPDGLGIRYQYLQLSLSEAEQATFFARWGNDLQSLIVQSFHAMDQRLARIQFNQERVETLRFLAFSVKLNGSPRHNDLPHVRALLSIHSPSRRAVYTKLRIGVCDDNGTRWSPTDPCLFPTLVGAFWTDDNDVPIEKSCMGRPEPLALLWGKGGFSEHEADAAQPTLGDLDENDFVFFMNQTLAERIDKIEIMANGYLLWSGSRSALSVDHHERNPRWPWSFSSDELSDPWVRIMPSGGCGIFRFDEVTPRRLYAASPL